MLALLLAILFNLPSAGAQGLGDLVPHQPLTPTNQLADPNNWMAIVGDSGTTGAASNESMKPDILNLLGHVLEFGLDSRRTSTLPALSDFPDPGRFRIDSVQPMTRVVYAIPEFQEAKKENKVVDLNLQAKASLALDVQEHANGYMIGRALGMRGQDIVLVGQDGVRVSAIPTQFERIYEMKSPTLPPLVLVSFTANDFCDNAVFTQPLADRRAQFEKSLAEAWNEAAPFLKAHLGGTKIVVLAPLEVANVLMNRQLLTQKVEFQGLGEITCERVREGEDLNGFLSSLMGQTLGNMCKAVLLTKPTDADRIQRLRDVQNAFNEVWKTQIQYLNAKYAGQNIEWIYVEDLRTLQYQAGDLANDCFHPGVGGHAKIADLILRTVFGR